MNDITMNIIKNLDGKDYRKDQLGDLRKSLVNPILDRYIEERVASIFISIAPLTDVPAMEMITKGELEGWCWQSTTFLSVFFQNSDLITRGNLTLDSYRYGDYFHAWMEIVYKSKEYVFDPALCILCQKDIYYSELNARVKAKVEVVQVKKSLIECLKNNEKSAYFPGTVYVPGTDDVNDSLFRVNSQLGAEIEEEKIKKLNARFFFNG